jgi:hypothetical protein
MDRKRRRFIERIGQSLIVVPIGLIAANGFTQMRSRPELQHPSAGEDGSPNNTPPPDVKLELKHSQQQIKDDVEKLFTLAEKLKEQVEKTDSTAVLSVAFVESTKQIESLAKHIRSLAVG